MTETSKERTVVFVSGNTDMNDKKFMQYYAYQLDQMIKNIENLYINTSDDDGCDVMVQLLVSKLSIPKENVTIFYMGDKIKNLISKDFAVVGGFTTLEERNAAMTLSSNMDFHVILEGKGRSAVEANLCRRNSPEYGYMKHWLTGNREFWSMFNEQSEKNG